MIRKTLEGQLSTVDLSEYGYCFVKRFESCPFKETSLDKLAESSPTESYWRIHYENEIYDAVKWTTPKRTRTFGFARTFELLNSPYKKLIFMPTVKDEGRVQSDFLGLETVAILNSFNLYVIVTYYSDAEPEVTKGKITITNQKLAFEDIANKIKEIHTSKISSSNWNRKEVQDFPLTLIKARQAYETVRRKLRYEKGVLSSIKQADRYLNIINSQGFDAYLEMRDRWKEKSQRTNSETIQAKEDIFASLKGKTFNIYFKDNLGVDYPLKFHVSPDESMQFDDNIVFIEKKKHESFSNFEEHLFRMVMFENVDFSYTTQKKVHFALGVTDDNVIGACYSRCKQFITCQKNNFRQCRETKLHGVNETETIFNVELFKSLLIHCNQNDHICFIIGREKMTGQTLYGIQKYVLENSIS